MTKSDIQHKTVGSCPQEDSVILSTNSIFWGMVMEKVDYKKD